ncbi:MAG: rod shape-determining protein MreC [Spirochaetaceae bacterium]|jgi:rod shape-determining protein MreC|nr:rod shape-determining protein MreC [Spirochaetaceae bacterium]
MRIRENRKRGRRFSRDAYVFAALTLVSFSLLLFSTRSFITSVRDAGLSAFSGIRGGIYGVSSFMSRTVLSIRELASLRREYNELAGRMTRYEQLERSAAEIRQENNRLREQLGFSEVLRYRHIPARLIGRDPDNLFSALVINKGTQDLVRVNMPVIAFQDGAQALVGKVIQAARMESLVMPLYDGSSFISARFAESRYEGIVEGQGNPDLPLVMRFIRKRAMDEISAGDVIVSAGLGGIYPPGLTIGRASRVLYQEYETSMGVELESAIDFSRLEYVFVLDAEGGEDG